jgi:hypothetical protein
MIGDTYSDLYRYVGRLMSETPNADAQFLALTFICAEIDKLKENATNNTETCPTCGKETYRKVSATVGKDYMYCGNCDGN